eukprot:762958-Hanusia_phi.AAC.8
MAGLLWVGMRWAMAEGGGGGVGVVLRRKSEEAKEEINDLRKKLSIMEDAECCEQEMMETGAFQHDLDAEPGKEQLGGVRRDEEAVKEGSVTGLSNMGAAGSRLQASRCRYCLKVGEANVMRRCGRHHKEGCLRYATCPQDLVNKVVDLRGKLSAVIERAEASANDDCVVIAKRHLEGPAYRSGEIDNGDILVAVDNQDIGIDVRKASRLILGSTGTICRLTIRKENGLQKVVPLTRVVIWGHSAPAGLFAPDKNYVSAPPGELC